MGGAASGRITSRVCGVAPNKYAQRKTGAVSQESRAGVDREAQDRASVEVSAEGAVELIPRDMQHVGDRT